MMRGMRGRRKRGGGEIDLPRFSFFFSSSSKPHTPYPNAATHLGVEKGVEHGGGVGGDGVPGRGLALLARVSEHVLHVNLLNEEEDKMIAPKAVQRRRRRIGEGSRDHRVEIGGGVRGDGVSGVGSGGGKLVMALVHPR